MSANSIVDFRDLEAWQAAMDLAVNAHELAAALPPVQKYEPRSQLRRAATSVPSNIAEGHATRSTRTFLRHVRIALGSLGEIRTLLELTVRLKLRSSDQRSHARTRLDRAGQLVRGLERALRRRLVGMAASALASLALTVTVAWLV
jgi:four helix bundle protein